MEVNNPTDSQLLERFQCEQHGAFENIYERYWLVLFKISKNILEDEASAKDVVQEVFISFYESARKKNISNLKAYLLQAAKYQCFMQLREGRISEKHLQRIQPEFISNTAAEEVEALELQKLLDKEIASLPEKCRQVFHLSRVELLPNKEIAEQLRISPKTVENQITKALKTLRISVDKLAVLVLVAFS